MAVAYTTKATRLQRGYGCRVYRDGVLIVEARCKTRQDIAPTMRDLLRTLDKLGGDAYTSAARRRIGKPGNAQIAVRHLWAR
jgi:hypothetical protein